ncbi:MAG: ribonuclease R [Ignavibacteriaceae bacterium]|nr:ribonuclease R [Ignavibacteriaceae bacterium]
MKKRLLAYFNNNPGKSIKARQLAEELDLREEHEYQHLKEVLHTLVTEGMLFRDGKRFRLNRAVITNRLTGTLEINRSGFGFVIPDDKNVKGDIFIAERNLQTAFYGDKVEVQILARQKGSRKNVEGEIINIIKRRWQEIAGTLHSEGAYFYVVPEIAQIRRNIYVSPEHLNGASPGSRVVLNDLVWENPKLNPHGKVRSVVTGKEQFRRDLEMVAEEFGIPHVFPKSVTSEAEGYQPPVTGARYEGRQDFRDQLVLTIDPDDAKDFDDALSIRLLENGNYEIGIHIADVSHYVGQGTELDKEAEKRGNSTYLASGVIPMLPENLSNSICSLVPNEDRLTFSVVVEMSSNARLVNYFISKSVIRSKRRFAYEEVQQIIEGAEGDCREELLTLQKIASQLRKRRMKNGSIDFSSTEVKFRLDEQGRPVEVLLKESKESHKLVEEFMLLANKLVAEYIKKKTGRGKKLHFIYRVHDKPNEEKLKDFVNLLKGLGYKVPPYSSVTPKLLNEMIATAKGKPEESLINEVGIRSMAKAEYSAQNIGHFGLGFQHYSHFTSPIRRYSDLVAHRMLFEYLHDNKPQMTEKRLETICEHISGTERTSAEAERHSVKMKQVEFMKDKVGMEFTGIISGVTNYGMFIKLQETFSEGLLRLRDLEDDRYYYDEKKFALIGRFSKRQYRLGDRIPVKLVRVDTERMEMDFLPVTQI